MVTLLSFSPRFSFKCCESENKKKTISRNLGKNDYQNKFYNKKHEICKIRLKSVI